MQREEDLRGDDLKHYEAEIEAMNLILISILNDIYNPGMLTHTGSSSRTSSQYYVTHPSLVVDCYDDYQGDTVQNNFDDLLTSAMSLLARTVTRNFSNPTNNCLHTSSNTKNQPIVQGDRVNIQSKYSGNDGKNTRRLYVQEEVIESTNVQNDAGNIQRTLRTVSSAIAMEKIEELSANICLMAIIQPTNIDSEAGPSYNSAFLSEVQNPSTGYVNPLFARHNQVQQYLKQPKIINNTIGDDQIVSNIIFDAPNDAVNSGSVEKNNNVQQSYELEQLARNTYKEAVKQQIIAKKVQKQNIVLTKQLESYKEKV
nr:hypothetical protein [Tanacetum cinerariifolium]